MESNKGELSSTGPRTDLKLAQLSKYDACASTEFRNRKIHIKEFCI
jgi:hypothetical protein